MRILLSVFLAACMSLLIGGGTMAQGMPVAPTGDGSLRNVDWANFTYTAGCTGEADQYHTRMKRAEKYGFLFQIYTPVYGDLTGDGKVEAAIPYSCTGADFGGVRVVVYTGNAASPRLMGDVPLPLPDQERTKNLWGSVDTVRIDQEMMTLKGSGYSSNAPHCCPDLLIQGSYRWDGSQFVTVNAKVTTRKGDESARRS